MTGVRTGMGVVALAATMAIGCAACGSSGTTVSTPNGSATVSSSGSGKNSTVKVKSNKGTLELNAGEKVPSGFPSAIPLPTFLKLSSSVGTKSQGKSGFDLIYDVSGSLTKAVDRYDQQLRSAGLASSMTATIDGAIEQAWKSSAWTVQVQGAPGSGPGQPPSLDLIVVPTSSS